MTRRRRGLGTRTTKAGLSSTFALKPTGTPTGPAVLSADSSILQVVKMTQTAYDALSPKDAATLYVIVG